ncbi:MAG TPA: hypothetical protein DCQ06_01595 [Myxococcales bacterium]|nr:hypothetical protein [Myxococcales bacterium]HAN30267.1 hypothetical protein [Myxococcales bacterium]
MQLNVSTCARPSHVLWLLILSASVACTATEDRGLHATFVPGATMGPEVVFEPHAEPSPEVPFPNDLAMAISADGGQHLSIRRRSVTDFERRFRHHLNEVPGFSGMTPITISFSGPLDLKTVTDQSVFVVNVQTGSSRFGEVIPLDLGRGWFPHTTRPTQYFPNDPLKDFDSLVLPPDNQVDTDDDGQPDTWVNHYEVKTHTLELRPLLPMEAGAQYAVIGTRDVKGWTGEQPGQGEYGQVHSPFSFVNHDSQTEALKRALPTLANYGLNAGDVAFGWTLTTGNLARTFRALREGLYGRGKFSWLADKFSPRIAKMYDMNISFDGLDDSHPEAHPGQKGYPYAPRDHDFTLQGPFMDGIFKIVNNFQPGVAGEFKHVAYAVFGDMNTVNMRAPKQTDQTERNVWQFDLEQGTAVVEPENVPFMITVPKTTANHQPPFPVIVYAHATGTSRVEALLLADRFAHAGIATFTIDAVGHGPVLPGAKRQILDFLGDDLDEATALELARALLGSYIYKDADAEFPPGTTVDEFFDKLKSNGFLQQLLVKGRGTDDNGDCVLNDSPGESYYAPNPMRLRDSMRQTTLDYIVAVRMLRSLGSNLLPALDNPRQASKQELLARCLTGDFNADGVLDIGGPNVPYFMTGISLGGIHTALTAPLEEHIIAAAPVVAGAGIVDIFIRTRLKNVIEKLMWKASGPVIASCPKKNAKDGSSLLSWNNDSDYCNKETKESFKADDGTCMQDPVDVPVWQEQVVIKQGDTVRATNIRNGEIREVTAGKDGRVMMPLKCDKGDEVEFVVTGEDGTERARVSLTSPYEGVAEPRNTPEFRRLVQTNANVLEGADAITVADRVFQSPLKGYPSTNLLMTLAVGDQTVNFAAGLSLARAIGLFGLGQSYVDSAPYQAWTEEVIRRGLLDNSNGAKINAGELSEDERMPPALDPSRAGTGAEFCNTVKTASGVSGLCLANVGGRHEYLAQVDKNDMHPPLKGYKPNYTEYHRNLIVSYFHSLGTKVVTDPCWADAKCIVDNNLTAQWEQPVGKTPQ